MLLFLQYLFFMDKTDKNVSPNVPCEIQHVDLV